MKKGTCKLCLRETDLCKSHLIPRAAYLLCRSKNAKNPNPLLITYEYGMQTSRQMQAPLLCFDCEQLLRSRGEDWVIPRLAHVGGPFLLEQTLRASTPRFEEANIITYCLESVPAVRVADLVHFGMGIFWKATVHNWVSGAEPPSLSFGSSREAVRSFILGKATFPPNMALSLTVLPSSVALSAFNSPYATRGENPAFHLYICGLNYTLWIGPKINEVQAVTSVHRSPHVLILTDNRDVIMRRAREAHDSALRLRENRKKS